LIIRASTPDPAVVYKVVATEQYVQFYKIATAGGEDRGPRTPMDDLFASTVDDGARGTQPALHPTSVWGTSSWRFQVVGAAPGPPVRLRKQRALAPRASVGAEERPTPVANAVIEAVDQVGRKQSFNAADGKFAYTATVPVDRPIKATLKISAPGYLPETAEVQLAAGEAQPAAREHGGDGELSPRAVRSKDLRRGGVRRSATSGA